MKITSRERAGLVIQALVLIGLFMSLNVISAAETPWVATWGGSEWEQGTGVAIDSDGYIYCVGATTSFGPGVNNLVLIKYASNGTQMWLQQWGGSGSDVGTDVAIDANGSIYCTGSTTSFGAGESDLFVVKYYPNGTQAWNTTWGTSENEHGNSIAIAPNGSIYCTGKAVAVSMSDVIVVKFDPDTGDYVHHVTWDLSTSDSASEIAVADDGAIYCAGNLYVGPTKAYDRMVIKFHPNMTLAWDYIWGGAAMDYALGITVDSNYVYCAGETWIASRRYVALAKFQCSDGAEVWNTTWGTADRHETAAGIVVNASEHIFCTGYISSAFVLYLFNPDGTLGWISSWDGSGSDYGYDLAIGPDNCFYCIGETTTNSQGQNDLALVKFLSDGTAPSSGSGGIPGFLSPLSMILIATLAVIGLTKKRIGKPARSDFPL